MRRESGGSALPETALSPRHRLPTGRKHCASSRGALRPLTGGLSDVTLSAPRQGLRHTRFGHAVAGQQGVFRFCPLNEQMSVWSPSDSGLWSILGTLVNASLHPTDLQEPGEGCLPFPGGFCSGSLLRPVVSLPRCLPWRVSRVQRFIQGFLRTKHASPTPACHRQHRCSRPVTGRRG